MRETAIIIADEIGKIVARVETVVLPQLQAFDSNIQGVFYEYGPGLEIKETLKQKDRSASFQFKKYPLVALLMDFEEERNPGIGVYAETKLTLVICHHTRPEYKTKERYEKNLKPILYPIYLELLEQLKLSGIAFSQNGEYAHTKIDHPYYGRDDSNAGFDFLDAIEMKGFAIRLYQAECFTSGSNVFKNS